MSRPEAAQGPVAVIADATEPRRRLAEAIEAPDIDVARLCATAHELLQSPGAAALDAVVLGEPASDGLDSEVRALVGALDGTPVVAVISDERAGVIRLTLDAGAAGIVPLDRLNSTLLPTLRATMAGQLAIPMDYLSSSNTDLLTTREKQILALVVMGLRNGEIAAKLFVSESTVKSHLTVAFNKLGVQSRREAVALILDPKNGVGTGILTIPTEEL